jgi:hypothetical protein
VIDPLTEKNHLQTPYAYAANNPVLYMDWLGLDTLNVNLPVDRSREGFVTLIVDGVEQTLDGGNQVLGRGTTNSGQNPTRDPMQTRGNTPTGEATVTVLDRDPDGNFVNADGTPVEGASGTPSAQLTAQGRYFILLNPVSGDILNSERTELGLHGGGTALGTNALQAQQRLVGTLGCGRTTNQTAAQIANQATDAIENNREFRVIIRELPATTPMYNVPRTF